MEEYFAGFSIYTGVVRYSDLGYLLATNDDFVKEGIPHTRIYTLDCGNWGGGDLDWTAISASVCYLPEERFIVISPTGKVQVSGGGHIDNEAPIEDGKYSPQSRGPLKEVRGIANGFAYAVGTCRQAYRRDGPGKWTCIDQTAQTSVEDITDTCFESLDGFSNTDIYAVGWEGEIWHYNGAKWEMMDSPTNLALFKVRCGGDGFMYACGQVGTLLRGKGTNWELIDHDSTDENLRGLQWYNDILYVSTMENLYKLVEGELLKVEFKKDVPKTFNHLSARDGLLWSIGAKDVMEYNGKVWRRIR